MSDLGTDASSAGPSTRARGPMIAGGAALSLLAAPLNIHILRALEEGPRSLLDLRRAAGSPPQSTMRVYSRTLGEQGILVSRRRPQFPSSADYELTQAGQELIAVARVLESWMSGAPPGHGTLGGTAWKSATKAMVEGWSTNIVRALAARPLSLTELNQVIPKLSYPSLERRLGSMRVAGLVEPQPTGRRGTGYAATVWLRRSVVPVACAAAWERRYRLSGAELIGRLGVEAAFLLAIPLLKMPSTFSGEFRLAVEVQSGDSPLSAGVMVRFENGAVASCASRLEDEADTSISGPPAAWLKRMSGAPKGGLKLDGDTDAAGELLDAFKGLSALPYRRAAR